MAVSGTEISIVKTGGELEQAWKEYGIKIWHLEAWKEAVEAEINTVMVARKLGKVVGYVTIRWGGPVFQDKEFAEAVESRFADGKITPAIYDLRVQEEHRKKRIGTKLMEGVKDEILHRSDVPARAALSVGALNTGAIRLYENLGYEYVYVGDSGVITIDSPVPNDNGGFDHNIEEGWVMAKDLSK